MYTNLSFLKTGSLFPDKYDKKLLNRYKNYNKLYDGEASGFLKQRMRNILPSVNSWSLDGKWIYTNYPKLITKKTRDFLLYETPIINIDETLIPKDEQIEIIDSSKLWGEVGKGIIDYSKLGDNYLMIDCEKKEFNCVRPAIVRKVFNPLNINDIVAYVIRWDFEENDKRYLRTQVHSKGYYDEYVCEYDGCSVGRYVTYKIDKDTVIPPLGLRVYTGLTDFMVMSVSNMLTSDTGYGTSDYVDIIDHITEIGVRQTLNSKALTKNAEPILAVPDSAIITDPKTGISTFNIGNAIAIRKNDEKAYYLNYDPSLNASFQQIDRMEKQLLMLSEMSIAFLNSDFGQAPSGEALRRMMTNTIMRIGRVADDYTLTLKRHLVNLFSLYGYNLKVSDIGIVWQDGIPMDELEKAQVVDSRVENGTLSTNDAKEVLDGAGNGNNSDTIDE